jgi:tetratricopeptide (TPR) repeat protein
MERLRRATGNGVPGWSQPYSFRASFVMSDTAWPEFTFVGGVLREPTPNDGQLILWLQGERSGSTRLWERLVITREPAPDPDWWEMAGTSIEAHERIHGFFGRLWKKWIGVVDGDWILPNGSSAQRVGASKKDCLVVWTRGEGAVDSETALKLRFGEKSRFRRLGDQIYLVDGAEARPTPHADQRDVEFSPQREAEIQFEAARRDKDCSRQARALADLGAIALGDGDRSGAIDLLRRAIDIARRFGNRAVECDARVNLARALSASGQNDKALELLQQELASTRRAGDRFQEKTILANLGTLYARLRDRSMAIRAFERALDLARDTRDRQQESELCWKLAIQNAEAGHKEKVLAYGERAIDILQARNHPAAREYVKALDQYCADRAAVLSPVEPFHGAEPLISQVAMGLPSDELAHLSADVNKQRGSSVLRMALSAAAALTKHLTSGMKRVSSATRQKRLAVCGECPHHTGVRCRICGCYTSIKTWLPHESCPLGNWE